MRLLIAEDQLPSALLLRRTLERLGHQVEVASDGRRAWEMVERGDIHLVICDWEMPGLDGPALCHLVRGRLTNAYVYIILLTSRESREDRLEGLRAGADDFLSKPADPEELGVRLQIAERILAVHEELARRNAVLAELATTDPLTGTQNRRRFHQDLEAHAAFASRSGLPLSLIMLDVDMFKLYNDRYGHVAGDEVLRELARTLEAALRKHDTVSRYGGEEFAVLLPSTDMETSRLVAERLRRAVADHAWPHRPITASFGVATLSPQAPDTLRLIEEADRALYEVKRHGRNHVRHHIDMRSECGEAMTERTPNSQKSRRYAALARLGTGFDRARPRLDHLLDLESTPGLLGLQSLSAFDDSDDLWLLTTWDREEDFHNWRRTLADKLTDREPLFSWAQVCWRDRVGATRQVEGCALSRCAECSSL